MDENNTESQKEAYIDDSLKDVESELNDDTLKTDDITQTEEELKENLNENDEVLLVFQREDWQEKVNDFKEKYPISTKFEAEIGDEILNNEELWSNEQCLEKALINVLIKNIKDDGERVNDEEFLNNYIYNNETIRGKIVDEYLEELDEDRLPSTMNRGGRISLASPTRPRNISDAGRLAFKIMNR